MLNKKTINLIILLLTFILLIVFCFYTYNSRKLTIIPECSTIIKVDVDDSISDLNAFYLLSIIPSKNNDDYYSLVINGEISVNNKKYVISRKFLVHYEKRGEHFFSRIDNVSFDPNDQAKDNIPLRGLPRVGQFYFIKVNYIDDKNALFEENFSPLFICTI